MHDNECELKRRPSFDWPCWCWWRKRARLLRAHNKKVGIAFAKNREEGMSIEQAMRQAWRSNPITLPPMPDHICA